jgi:hypothetical protein
VEKCVTVLKNSLANETGEKWCIRERMPLNKSYSNLFTEDAVGAIDKDG